MRLVLLGAPGAGKGTQGQMLSQQFGIPRIATGDMFRAALQSGSEIGNRAKGYIERGELVPDEITIAIVRERLAKPDCEGGFVLDGFPRTVAQARALDETLAPMGRPLQAAILIEVPEEVAVRRVSQRRVCSRCDSAFAADDARVKGGRCPECGGPLIQRPDDDEGTVRRRLRVYHERTQPVIDYYREQGRLLAVDGDRPADEVFAAICRGVADMARRAQRSGRAAGNGEP